MLGLTKKEASELIEYTLTDSVYQTIFQLDFSKEVCGSVFGGISDDGKCLQILLVQELDNHSTNDDEFLIDIEELHSSKIEAFRLIGVYHTHVMGFSSEPSAVDRYYQRLFPLVWLIISKSNSLKMETHVSILSKELLKRE